VTPIVLATVSALVWGASDFCGGKGAQRASALAVTVVSQLFSVPVLAVGVLVVAGTPRLPDLAWGAAAGTAGLLGIVLLYRGLAGGAMVVVAPLTAVTAAVLPLAVGLVTDGVLSGLTLIGIGCAVAAIALISAVPGRSRAATGAVVSVAAAHGTGSAGGAAGRAGGAAGFPARLVGLALLAGAMFGTFFVLLGQAQPGTGMWAMVGVRASSIPLGLLVVAVTGTSLRLPRGALGWAAIAGPMDVTANGLFLLAAMQGHLGLVAVLASLYPVSTVLLALAVDKERVRILQVVGLGLAAGALVLVTT
jgi:drug/metabolite transporter (DMT)-like permease